MHPRAEKGGSNAVVQNHPGKRNDRAGHVIDPSFDGDGGHDDQNLGLFVRPREDQYRPLAETVA